MDPIAKALLKLCDEMHELRNDLFDAEMIRSGAAFATSVKAIGSFPITAAQMVRSTTPTAFKVYENATRNAAAVYVRLGPVTAVLPPDGFFPELTTLFLDNNADFVSHIDLAAVVHTGYGDGITVVLQPNSVLYAAVMASGNTNLAWRAVPLLGRRILGESRDL